MRMLSVGALTAEYQLGYSCERIDRRRYLYRIEQSRVRDAFIL